jgi:hypothetical protein
VVIEGPVSVLATPTAIIASPRPDGPPALVSAANAGAPVPPVRFSPYLADPGSADPASAGPSARTATDRAPVAAAPQRNRAKDREPVELGASREMILQAAKANADQLAGRLPVRKERHSAAGPSVPEPAPIQLTSPGGAPSRSTGLFQVLASYLLPPSGPPTGVLYLLVNLAWVLMAAALVAPRFLMLRLPDLPSSRRAGYRAVALRPG